MKGKASSDAAAMETLHAKENAENYSQVRQEILKYLVCLFFGQSLLYTDWLHYFLSCVQIAYTEDYEQQRGKGSFPAMITPGYYQAKKAQENASDVSMNFMSCSIDSKITNVQIVQPTRVNNVKFYWVSCTTMWPGVMCVMDSLWPCHRSA